MSRELLLNEDVIKNLTMDYFMKTSSGEKLQKAFKTYETVQAHIFALQEKGGEEELTLLKVGTIITFCMLQKYANGKGVKDFSNDDWKSIAKAVSEYAILPDNQQYSIFVFDLYNKYIDYWIRQMEGTATEKTLDTIRSLAVELQEKKTQLIDGNISEVVYIEDCLWICLEAMIKLLAASVSIITVIAKKKGKLSDKEDLSWLEDLSEAVAMFAFEYGRYVLFSKEQALLTEYVNGQYELDAELEEKYREYTEELQSKANEFYELIDKAFVPDFRESYLASIKLARKAGVDEGEILTDIEDVDDFFLN